MPEDEIERKFLVSNFPATEDWPVEFVDSNIVQVYLLNPNGETERVRRRRYATEGRETLTHNLKVYVGPGHFKEDEREIDGEEFFDLRRRADPSRRPVVKVRRTFPLTGFVWELDLYQVPGSVAILEVELPALDVPLTLPPFLQVAREVTGEEGWSNYAMARKDWKPPSRVG